MSIVKKCGPFIQDDAGNVAIRKGKKFRNPKLSQKDIIPYPSDVTEEHYCFLGFLLDLEDYFKKCSNIDKLNIAKEKKLQAKAHKELRHLCFLYTIQRMQLGCKIINHTVRKSSRRLATWLIKTERAYRRYKD